MVVLFLYFVFSTCISISTAQNCPTLQNSCDAMHTFAITYDTLKAQVQNLANQMTLLKNDLDTAIVKTCGSLGSSSAGNTHLYQTTYCDFEGGNTCIFTPSQFVLDSGISDHTTGSKLGHVLYHHRDYYQRNQGTLVSTIFQPSDHYCIRFYYTSLNGAGSMNVYLQVGSSRGYPIFTATKFTEHEWQLAEITPDSEYTTSQFKIVIEVAFSGGHLYVDDFLIYNAPCSTDGIRTPVCPQGSIKRKGLENMMSCYTFHPEPMTFLAAIQTCKLTWPGATLLQIETADEQAFIANIINKTISMSNAADFGIWTGGNDVDTEHTFVWNGPTHPIAFNYTHWHPGQPNNIGGDQDCVLIQYKSSNYEWGDVNCNEKHSFICEMNYDVRHQPSHQYPSGVIG